MTAKSSAAKKKVEVDLEKFSTPTVYRDESRGVHLPADVPVYLRVFRLLETRTEKRDNRKVDHLTGWTVQLDAFTFGVKAFLRIGRDGTLRLFVEDNEGRQKVAEWEKQ